MRAQLELLTGFLVNVRGTQYRIDFLVGRQWNRSANYSTGALYGFYNFVGRFIYKVVVVRLQPCR